MTSPLNSVDPTAALFLPSRPGPVIPTRYRSGRVLSWNRLTAENTIDVDGLVLTDVPLHPGEYVRLVQSGDVVSLLTTTDLRGLATVMITGLPLRPGDPRLEQPALGGLPSAEVFLAPAGTTTSPTFVFMPSTPTVSIDKRYPTTALRWHVQSSGYLTAGADAAEWGLQVTFPDGDIITFSVWRFYFNNPLTHLAWGSVRSARPADDARFAMTGTYTARAMWLVEGGRTLNIDINDRYSLTMEEVR